MTTSSPSLVVQESGGSSGNEQRCSLDPDNVHEKARHYILILLTPLILLFNIMVLVLLGIHRQCRRPDLLLIASLCCADITVGGSAIASIMSEAKETTMNGCLLRVGLSITAVQTSIFSLLAISVDRLLAIVMNLRYTTMVTVRGILIFVLTLWCLAIVCGLLPYLGWNLGEENYTGYCSFLLVLPPSAVACTFVFALLPIAAILLIHFYLYAKARVHIRKIDALERVLGRSQKPSGALGMSGRAWRSVRTVSLVAGCVLACWCPFLLTSLYVLIAENAACVLNVVVGTHLLVLGYVNSALNPVVYALRNRELRAVAAKALVTLCRNNYKENT